MNHDKALYKSTDTLLYFTLLFYSLLHANLSYKSFPPYSSKR